MASGGDLLLATASRSVQLYSVHAATSANSVSRMSPYDPTAIVPINCVRWNHNNKVLATCADDPRIILSHTQGVTLGQLDASDEEVYGLCFSSGSRYLASGGSRGVVQVWDLVKRQAIKEFEGHTAAISCLQFASNDTHIASGSQAGTVLVHSIFTGLPVSTMTDDTAQGVRSIQYSPFRRSWLSAGYDSGLVSVWDANTQKSLTSFSQHQAPVTSVAFSTVNNLLLASAGLDKRLYFYDVPDKKVVKCIQCVSPINAMDFSHDGFTIAVGTSTGSVLLYDLRSGSQPFATVMDHAPHPVNSVQFQRKEKPAAASAPSSAKSARSVPTTRQNAGDVSATTSSAAAAGTAVSRVKAADPSAKGSAPTSLFSPLQPTRSAVAKPEATSGGLDLSLGGPDVSLNLNTTARNMTNLDLSMSMRPSSKDAKPDTRHTDTGARVPPVSSVLTPLAADTLAKRRPADGPDVTPIQRANLALDDTISPHTPNDDESAPPDPLNLSSPLSLKRGMGASSAVKGGGLQSMDLDSPPRRKPNPAQKRIFAGAEKDSIFSPLAGGVATTSSSAMPKDSPVHEPPVSQKETTTLAEAMASLKSGPSAQAANGPATASTDAGERSAAASTQPSQPKLAEHTTQAPRGPAAETGRVRIQEPARHAEAAETKRDLPMSRADLVGEGVMLQSQVVTNTLEERLASFRAAVHEDIQNLHLDLIRQFHVQQMELTKVLKESTAQIQPLLQEVKQLRMENMKLRRAFYGGGAVDTSEGIPFVVLEPDASHDR